MGAAAAMLAAVLLLTPITVPAGYPGAVAPATAACPDAEVVFARGRFEPPGIGTVGNAFVSALRSKVNKNVGVYAVKYPADNQIDVGANDMSAHIQSMANSCPNTRLVPGGYSLGAAVHLAMAALALTILQWNRTHDVPAADSVSVNMPVNFRPTAWSTEVISNFASYLAIVLRVDEVTDLEKATAIVAGITGPLKQSGAAGWVVDLLEGGKVLPAMLKRQLQLLLPLVEDRFVESVCLSNLGRVDVPAFGGEAGDTTEVWFSPTAAMSVMPIGVGLVGFGGTLRAMFRGDGRTIGGEALGRFAALYRDTLLT